MAGPSTRERILRETAALFRQQGFNGTSMRDVARAVGVTKSSLYHHFPSKQALLSNVLELTVARGTPRLGAIAEADLPAAERLRRAVAEHLAELIRDQDAVACFVEEGRFLSADYRPAHLVKRDRYESHFRRIIEDGIESGEFRSVDVRLAGLAVLGMCNSVATWYRPEGTLGSDEIATEYAELAARALAAGPEPGRLPAREV